jgi:hypothetical protein
MLGRTAEWIDAALAAVAPALVEVRPNQETLQTGGRRAALQGEPPRPLREADPD